MAVSKPSLADAKVLKYRCKYIGGGDGAGDGTEVMDGFAEVLGYEVARDA